jgi:hypothetical protein
MNRILPILLCFVLILAAPFYGRAQVALSLADAAHYKNMLSQGHTRAYMDSCRKHDGKYYKAMIDPNKPLATGPEQDCASGIPVCSNFYSQATSYNGFGSTQEVNTTTSCLQAGEQCSVWYIFTIQPGGTTLRFTLSTTNDYDWSIYDLTAIGGCQNIPTSNAVSCNFSVNPGNTGISTTLAGTNGQGPCGVGVGAGSGNGPFTDYTQNAYNCDLTVVVGHTYAMIIDNFTQDQNGYTLNFAVPGATATLFNTTPPTIASVTDDCSNSVTMTMSELVTCASIDKLAGASSDFSLSGPAPGMSILSAAGVGCTGVAGQTTSKIVYTLSAAPAVSGTYTLTAKNGSDGNTLTNYCTNASLAVGAAITFHYLAPISLSTTTPTICAGGSGATISTIGNPAVGGTYVWTPSGGATPVAVVNPATTTTFQEKVTFGTCSQTVSQLETFGAKPICSVGPTNPSLCAGGKAVLTASSTISGGNCASCTYRFSDSTSTNPTAAHGAGTFTVFATSTQGCKSAAVSTTITTAPPAGACTVIFVSPAGGGNGASPATPTDIFTALGQSLCNGAYIKMQVGIYNILLDYLVLNPGITIEGGYNSTYTTKTSDMSGGANSTTIRRSGTLDGTGVGGNTYTAFYSAGNISGFRLQDLRIELPGAAPLASNPANAPGSAITNYGIYLGNTGGSCSNYNIVRCYIDAGAGANGTNGVPGSNGTNGIAQAGQLCSDNTAGAAGTGGVTGGGAGGQGGNTGGAGGSGCAGEDGAAGVAGAGGASGGATTCCATTGHVICSTSHATTGVGNNGTNGTDGTDHSATIPTAASYNTYFVGGADGLPGTDGGGGGGGGGSSLNNDGTTLWHGVGGTGGGSGGSHGTQGTAGYGAFGVFSVAHGAASLVTDCRILAVAGTAGTGTPQTTGGAGGVPFTCAQFTAGNHRNSPGVGGTGGKGGGGGVGAAGDFALVCDIQGGSTKVTAGMNTNPVVLNTQPIIVAGNIAEPYVNCINIPMNMTSPGGTFGGSAPLAGAGNPQTVTYTTIGRKDVTFTGGFTYTGFNNMISAPPGLGTAIASNTEICPGTASFTSSLGNAAGFSFLWTVSPSAGVTISAPTAFTTNMTFPAPPVPPGNQVTYTITLDVTSSCCGHLGTTTTTIIIDPIPPAPTITATPATICPGGSCVLSVPFIAGTSYNWYSAPSGGSPLGTGTSLTVNPSSTTTYYVDATGLGGFGACVSTPRSSVVVTVVPTTPPVCPPVTACGGSNVTMTVGAPTIAGATYVWNSSDCSGQLQSGNSLTYSTFVASTTTFYVAVIDVTNGCNVSACTPVVVTITTAPASVTWTGTGATGLNNWFDPVNWGGCMPTCATNVNILNDNGNPPDIGSSLINAACQTITLAAGTHLSFSSGKAELDVCGDFLHNGTITTNNKGVVAFIGTVPQNYTRSNTAGAGNFNNIVLANTAGAPSLTVNEGTGFSDLIVGSAALNVGSFSFQSGLLITKGNRALTIMDTACGSVSGHSLNSYVFGNLTRFLAARGPGNAFYPATTYSYDFPVGNGTSYQLMNLRFKNCVTLTNVTVSFTNPSAAIANGTGLPLADGSGSYTTLLNNGGTAIGTGAATGGIWTVIPINGAGNSLSSGYTADYEMMLYGRNFSNFTANVSHLKRNTFCPGIWTCDIPSGAGGYVSGVLDGNNNVVTDRDSMNQFSQFAIAMHSTVLPIDLVLFQATCIDNKVDVNWVSASEVNNSKYTLERSCDNENTFETVATLPGAGTSSFMHQYTWHDSNFPGGTCYYRLKQTDFNGTTKTFKTIGLDCKENLGFALVSMFPNPTQDEVSIFYNSDQSGTSTLTVTDLLGKTLLNKEMPTEAGLNQTSIDLTSFSNAVYFIKLNNGTRSFVRKITKAQ